MSLYQQTDYRKALRDILDLKKQSDPAISFASYAEAIGVQKTFISKVLGGTAHLSDDQVYLTLIFLNFSDEDSKYFRLLHDYSRTGLNARKKVVLAEIRKIQEEKRQFRIHTSAEVQKPESSIDMGEYYLDPLNLIVHAYLGIPRFAASPNLISTEMELPVKRLSKILSALKKIGVIDFTTAGGKVKVLKNALHLDVESMYCQPHQQLFRLKSAEQITSLSPEKRFVYSLTFSGDHELKGQIQEMFLKFIKKVEAVLDQQQAHEDVYQVNFDLFPWSKKP